MIKIYPHWNGHKAGDKVNVWCNSNADEVELVLNGKSLGKKVMPRNGHLEWDVIYEAGKLGFKRVYVPKNSLSGWDHPKGIELIGVSTVAETLHKVFPNRR